MSCIENICPRYCKENGNSLSQEQRSQFSDNLTDLRELSDLDMEIITGGGGNQYPKPVIFPILTIKWKPVLF